MKEWFEGLSVENVEEIEMEKCYWRRIGFAFFLGLLTILLVMPLFTTAGNSTYSTKDSNGNSVRLLDEPCPDVPQWMNLRKADMFYRGKNYKACWVVIGTVVVILDDNGDSTALPIHQFVKDLEG